MEHSGAKGSTFIRVVLYLLCSMLMLASSAAERAFGGIAECKCAQIACVKRSVFTRVVAFERSQILTNRHGMDALCSMSVHAVFPRIARDELCLQLFARWHFPPTCLTFQGELPV